MGQSSYLRRLEMTGNGWKSIITRMIPLCLELTGWFGEAEKLENEYGIKLPETWETDKYGNRIEKVEDIYHIYDDGTQET